MATEKRLIYADDIPWEEYYVPDPDSNAQWDYKKEFSVTKPIADQMPTVDAVEVVHGRWVEAGFDGHGDYKECCSNCLAWSIGADKLYCPVCGAKMDGDGNG